MTLLFPTIELHIAALACLIALVIGMAIGGAIHSSDAKPHKEAP